MTKTESVTPTTTTVNSLEMKTEGGKKIWYWNAAPGSSCGSDRYRYEVQPSDMQGETGKKCPDGRKLYEITYFGTPVKV